MKLCCIFNYNPQYRFPIYEAMDKNFDCDFYFGKDDSCGIKTFDPNLLLNFKGYITPKHLFGPFSTYKGVGGALSEEYTHYIITGEPFFLSNWRILIYALLHRKKVFFWTHGAYGRISKPWTRIITKMFYKYAHLLLYGEHAGQYMKELGCKKENIHYIHNSLDTKIQTELYSRDLKSDIYKQHFGNDNPVAIYIGRIQKRKKLDQLIEAVSILNKRGHTINVVIVGPNTDDTSINRMVKENGLDSQIWFYGPSYDENTNAVLLYNAEVCVSPGNVGLTSIHSLSYGTPVVTNDNFDTQMPEFEAIQSGLTASFFHENDVNSLANAIEDWIQCTPSKTEMTRRLAREKIANEWSVNYQIELLKKVL